MEECKLIYNGVEYKLGDLFSYGDRPITIIGFMATENGVQIFGYKYINGNRFDITLGNELIKKLIKIKE